MFTSNRFLESKPQVQGYTHLHLNRKCLNKSPRSEGDGSYYSQLTQSLGNVREQVIAKVMMSSVCLCLISLTSCWGDLFTFCAQIFTLAAYRKMYVHVQVQNTFRAPGFQQDLYYILIGNTSDLLKIIFWNCTYLDLCMGRFLITENIRQFVWSQFVLFKT